MKRLSMLYCLIVLTAACGTPRQIPDEVVWEDDDRRPIEKPEENFSAKVWDAVDQTAFRPLTRALLVEGNEPAHNVNALGEVPNSSWYTNRMAVASVPAERVVQGPCEKPIDESATWVVQGGKVGGFNPGFIIEDSSDGRKYLLKFDRSSQRERPTAADVIGSKVYWAAGFSTPCNEIVFFDIEQLRIEEGAMKKTEVGAERPLEMADLVEAMRSAPRNFNGRIRASASLFLPGEPIGPFRYEGTRSDDPNDVIPHQHRRELRGSKLLAAWINHFDSREANTLTTFMPVDEKGERGYVQHHILDFGDSLGSQWEFEAMSRRLGHAYYFDPGQVLVDFLTLGAIVRPWERVELHDIFGYFDAKNFNPRRWKPGYPNPAFAKMDPLDAYWGAKIVSRFSDAHVRALVEAGKFSNPEHETYLEETLRARRDAIVNYYLREVSPFDDPEIRGNRFCATDLLVGGGYVEREFSELEVQLDDSRWQATVGAGGLVCAELPAGSRTATVRMRARRLDQDDPAPPATFYLQRDTGDWRLIRITR